MIGAGPAAALGLILAVLIVTNVSLLTSPDRTGSEGIVLLITASLGAILSAALASWWSGPYRSNKDNEPDH